LQNKTGTYLFRFTFSFSHVNRNFRKRTHVLLTMHFTIFKQAENFRKVFKGINRKFASDD
jgi:hypothetical protein